MLPCFAYVGMTSVRNGSVLPTPTQCIANPIPVDLPFSLIGISQCSGILWKGQPKTENSKLWLLPYKYTVTFSFPNVGRLNRIPPRCNLDSVRPLPVPHKNNKGNHETFHFSIKYKNNLMQLSFTSIAVEIFFEVRSFLQNIS